jgi:hypothetical protein
MVVLQGRVERRSLIPFLIRAVNSVGGVVRVEDQLTFDIDDRDVGVAMTLGASTARPPSAPGRHDLDVPARPHCATGCSVRVKPRHRLAAERCPSGVLLHAPAQSSSRRS